MTIRSHPFVGAKLPCLDTITNGHLQSPHVTLVNVSGGTEQEITPRASTTDKRI